MDFGTAPSAICFAGAGNRAGLRFSPYPKCACLGSAAFRVIILWQTMEGRDSRLRRSQVALGALVYAQDYDETLPLLDNNGPCFYAVDEDDLGLCATPDWGNSGDDPKQPGARLWSAAAIARP